MKLIVAIVVLALVAAAVAGWSLPAGAGLLLVLLVFGAAALLA